MDRIIERRGFLAATTGVFGLLSGKNLTKEISEVDSNEVKIVCVEKLGEKPKKDPIDNKTIATISGSGTIPRYNPHTITVDFAPGTIQWMPKNNILEGWAIMDGKANSKENGGTGYVHK